MFTVDTTHPLALPRGLEPLSCGFGDRCVSITPRQHKNAQLCRAWQGHRLLSLAATKPTPHRKSSVSSTPYGIRTRDLHLERVVSLPLDERSMKPDQSGEQQPINALVGQWIIQESNPHKLLAKQLSYR